MAFSICADLSISYSIQLEAEKNDPLHANFQMCLFTVVNELKDTYNNR